MPSNLNLKKKINLFHRPWIRDPRKFIASHKAKQLNLWDANKFYGSRIWQIIECSRFCQHKKKKHEKRPSNFSWPHFRDSPPSAMAEKSVKDSSNNVPILKNCLKFRFNSSQVIGHDKRCSQHRPNGHLHATLIDSQTIISDNQHIRIIPMTRSRMRLNATLVRGKVVGNLSHRLPRVINIIPISPQITVQLQCLVVGLKSSKRKRMTCDSHNHHLIHLTVKPFSSWYTGQLHEYTIGRPVKFNNLPNSG